MAFIAQHLAMPFGATASVIAWNRLGGLIAKIARTILYLPLWRYVDDYFSASRPVFAGVCVYRNVHFSRVGLQARDGETLQRDIR